MTSPGNMGLAPARTSLQFPFNTNEKKLFYLSSSSLCGIKRMTTLLCTASRISFNPLLRSLSSSGNSFRAGTLFFCRGRLHQQRGYLLLQTVLNPRSVCFILSHLSSMIYHQLPLPSQFFLIASNSMMNTLSLSQLTQT